MQTLDLDTRKMSPSVFGRKILLIFSKRKRWAVKLGVITAELGEK